MYPAVNRIGKNANEWSIWYCPRQFSIGSSFSGLHYSFLPPPSLTSPTQLAMPAQRIAFIASVAEFDLLVINLSCPYPVWKSGELWEIFFPVFGYKTSVLADSKLPWKQAIFHQVFLQQLISRYKVGLKSLVASRTRTIERHWFLLNLNWFGLGRWQKS